MPGTVKLPIGDKKILQRVIPKNPRYEKVRHVVDTGNSTSRLHERLLAKSQFMKRRSGELFRRIKVLTLVRLIHELSIFGSELFQVVDIVAPVPLQMQDNSTSYANDYCSNFIRSNIINRSNTVALTPTPATAKNIDDELPFLLFDCRSHGDFSRAHILTARHYDPQLLQTSRAFTREILKYQNDPEKLLIFYDQDESIASRVAQSFCERGLTNVWMLSGGVDALRVEFDMLLIANDDKMGVDFQRLEEAIFCADAEPTISDVSSVRRFSSSSRGASTTGGQAKNKLDVRTRR